MSPGGCSLLPELQDPGAGLAGGGSGFPSPPESQAGRWVVAMATTEAAD